MPGSKKKPAAEPKAGNTLADKLARLGVAREQDLVLHLPLRYEDHTHLCPLAALKAGQAWQIALPAARRDDIAALHQKTVADVDRRIGLGIRGERRPRRPVEVRHRDRVATIHDVDQRAP